MTCAKTDDIQRLHTAVAIVLSIVSLPDIAQAQVRPLCIPGTQLCAGAVGNGGVQAGGQIQGQAGPSGASGTASGNANAGASGNAAANGQVGVGASGSGNLGGQSDGAAGGDGTGTGEVHHHHYYSEHIRFGAGLLLCATAKAGVYSGIKGGPCFAVSFRTERVTFEMETQLLFGGVRHSVDWVFPMSFVIPLTTQRSLYEGLQLRVGGSPVGVTFARTRDGGSYMRFGLHAGLSYEWGISRAITWRLFDVRTFLDFGTRRQVDLHDNFLDFGGQLSTGIVF